MITVSPNSPWIIEGDQFQGENATIPWTIVFPWATTLASVTVQVFKEGSTADVAGTVMPSGSHSTTGNSLTMKPLTALTGGEWYILAIQITVDGVADEWFMRIGALKQETGKM